MMTGHWVTFIWVCGGRGSETGLRFNMDLMSFSCVQKCEFLKLSHKSPQTQPSSQALWFFSFFSLFPAVGCRASASCGYHRKQDVIQERACWMNSCNIFLKITGSATLWHKHVLFKQVRWTLKQETWLLGQLCTHTHTHTSTNYFSSLQGWGLTSWKKNLSIFHNHYWHCLCFLSRGHYISQQAVHILRGQLCKSC